MPMKNSWGKRHLESDSEGEQGPERNGQAVQKNKSKKSLIYPRTNFQMPNSSGLPVTASHHIPNIAKTPRYSCTLH
jgi:hypothetical protein